MWRNDPSGRSRSVSRQTRLPKRLLARATPHLQLEPLEDRLLLAKVYWNIDADGFWDVASNWRDEFGVSRLPTSEDSVFLDRPSGAFTVTHRSGATDVKFLRAERSTFVLSGGALNVFGFDGSVPDIGNVSRLGGDFLLSGGVLNGVLTTSGNMVWSGGFLGVSQLFNTGTMTLNGAGGDGNALINNFGTINDGTGLSTDRGASMSIINATGGVYDLLGDVNPPVQFFNHSGGTLRKSGGTGTVAYQAFHNFGGSVEVRSGGLFLDGRVPGAIVSPTWTGGNFHVAEGASLDFVGDGLKFEGTFTGSGAGRVRFRGQSLEIDSGGITLGFGGAPLEYPGTRIDARGVRFNNTGGLKLTATSTVSFGGVLSNSGSITYGGTGNLQLAISGANATLNNLAGGLFDLQGDADFEFGVFNNAGTLRKSAGTGLTTSISGNIFNNLGGTIDVRTGTVAIAGSTGGSTGLVFPSHTGGHYRVAQGATLDLTSGASNVRQIFTGNYTSSGDGLLRLNGGTVMIGPGGATFDFDAYQWSDGRIDGGPDGLTNAGILTLAATNGMPLVNNLINAGTIIHSASAGDLGNGSFAFPGNGTLTNLAGAIYDFQVDRHIAIETFINRGTLRKSAGAGTAFMSTRNFSNEKGTIDIQSGTLQVSGIYNSMVGGLSTGGVFNVAAGAVLDLTSRERTVRYSGTYTGSGAGTVRVRAGVLQAGAAGATFNFPPGLFQWTGGIIAGGATGLTNAGSVSLSVGAGDDQFLSGLFNNVGTVTHADIGDLHLSGFGNFFTGPEGTFNNLASGVYDIQSDGGFRGGIFNNSGILRKSAGVGDSATLFGHRFNNLGGTIDVRSGTFLLQGTSGVPFPTHTGGTFFVAAGASLGLTNEAGPQILTGNYTGSGRGLIEIIGLVNTANAIAVGSGGATFDFPDGLLQWSSGVIDARQAPLTNRGSMTVLPGTPFVRLRGTLNNAGTLVHPGDGVISINGESGLGNLTNLAGGVYEFRGNGSIQLNTGFGPGAAVHNFGTLRKTGAAGTATIDTDFPFDNAGTVEVNTGRLLVRSPVTQVNGTTLEGGTWKVGTGGLLELEDHPRLSTNQATVVLDGPGSRFPAFEQAVRNTGNIALLGGRSLSVPVGRVARDFAVGLQTTGIAFDPSSGNLFAYPTSSTEIRRYTPAGTELLPRIPVPGGGANRLDLDVAFEPLTIGGTAVPAGTLLVIHGSNATLYGIDRNTGTILASVTLSRPFGTIVGGAYHAGRNTFFIVDSSTVYEMDPATGALVRSFAVQPAGSPPYSLSFGDLDVDPITGNVVIVNGDGVAIRELTPTGQFVRDMNIAALNLGRLAGIAIDENTRHLWVCNTNGLIYGLESLFTNSGKLILGPGSTLDVPGAFSQDATGTLTTQLGGNPASGQFGRVTATTSSLDGGLGVELTNGFGPATGQQFPILAFTGATGSFSKFAGLSGGRMPLFTVDQSPTGIRLNAVGSAADLSLEGFVAATFPTTATPGQTISITYDVRNLSQIAATGEWVDSLYLSRDSILDAEDALLGRVQHQGGVGGMSSYRETVTAPLPPLAEGRYRVILLSDSRGLVSEANRANNIGFSDTTIAVTVPLLTLGTPVMGSIAAGQDRYYRVVAPPGKDLKITGDFSTGDAAEMYLRYRDVPDRSNFDQTAAANSRQQRLVIGSPQGGSYYLLVHGREGAATGSSFTLRAETAGFEIVRVSPLRGSNQGLANVEVVGSQFTPQTRLSLHHDAGAVRSAQSVQFVDANRLRAVFDLQGLTPSAYQIQAEDPAVPGPAIALDTFTVTDEPPGIVSLRILAPAFVRVGASIPVEITILNGNDSPAVAPILQVAATNVEGGQERRVVLGSGLDALPGVLPPLYEGGVSISYEPSPKSNGVTSTFALSVLNPSSTLIDWDSQKEKLRPSTIPADAWDAIWANLRPALGNTLADLYALLQNDARELFYLGHHINSVSRLFQFELRKANDLPAVPVPATAVDLAFQTPGLPLVFARDYGASIAERFSVGRLGRGWVDNFDIALTNDSDNGVVTIRYGHTQRPFGKDKMGAYHGLPGDFAVLTEVGGNFQLREKTGEVTVFRADGMLGHLQDTNGNRITANYTGNLLTRLAHSNGSAFTLDYNAQGRISQVTDPAGRVATYVYDASGQHLQRVTTSAGTTEYTYTPDAAGPRAHALASIGFPAGTHLFFDYDSQGRLARQQRDGGAEPLTFIYGAASYRLRDALGNVSIVSYDDLGLTKDTWDGLSRRTIFSHSASRNLPTRITGPGGLSSTFEYDERGNPVQAFDPMGRAQQFEYEPTFNSLDLWRDALGRVTDFNVDSNGKPLSTTYPDGTIEEVGYDGQGNLVRAVNRRGQTVRYTYDVNGLLRTKELPGGVRIEYLYDTRGNLLSATGPTGAIVIEYDAADRMTKITYPGGRFLKFAYDAGGRRIRSTDQSGFSLNYRYNATGRLEELTGSGDQRLVLYQYDPVGRIASETRGNGITTNYEYDGAGQLLHLVHRAPNTTVLSRFDYTYDDNGHRTSMTTLEGTTEYVYDAAGQLTLVSLPSGRIIQYNYDQAGNRREVSDDGVTTAYIVNDMNQYQAVGSFSQRFDADGNLASKMGPAGPQSYAYDPEGRLISMVTPQGTWTYEYDVFGNRVATTHNGARTEYLIDPSGLGNVVAEYDGAGNLRAHYAHGLGLVSRIDFSGPAAYFQFDAGGNTALLTGLGGTVLNAYSYLPFGETLSASETVANPFTHVGQLGVMQEENGLHYMRNRWYDPVQGRFTQQDPIGLLGGTNHYAYVRNNPLTFSDPTGLITAPSAGLLVEGIFIANGGALGAVSEALSMTSPSTSIAALDQDIRYGTLPESRFPSAGLGTGGTGFRAPNSDPLRNFQHFDPADIARLEARAAATQAARAPSRAGIIGAAIQTGLALFSLKRGLRELAITGDLPACFLPDGSLQRLFELCKGESPGLLDLLDQLHPLAGAIAETIQLEPSKDPNDIAGPAGFGSARFLADRPILPYTILFENIPAAEGPAAQVVVTHQLDNDLDLKTFQLGDFGFGDLVVDVPDGRQYYSTRLDLRSTRNVFVDVTADLDLQTRVVTWTLTALDPGTLDIPIDPFTGFLPPNKIKPEGEGFVNFSVRPKAGSPTGTRIDAQATIVFDTNDPIDTPLWTNTIDIGAPSSTVSVLPQTTDGASFTVSWSGQDDVNGSGIGSYDIYVSRDGGAFALWLDNTTSTEATYTGEAGHIYSFYSIARDNVGHLEQAPSTPDAQTAVVELSLGSNQQMDAGTLFIRDAAFISPGSAQGLSARVDWGDGTQEDLGFIPAARFTLSHRYLREGLFNVRVTISDGGTLVASRSLVLTALPPVLNGSDGDDFFTVSHSDGLVTISRSGLPGPTHIIDPAGISGITINAGGGNDTLVLAAALPFTPVFNAGSGSNTLDIRTGSFRIDFDLGARAAELALLIGGGAELTIGSSQHLTALSMSGSARVVITSAGAAMVIGQLRLAQDALLDVGRGGLIIRNGTLSAMRAFVQMGRNTLPGGVADGTWDGIRGITSGAARSVFAAERKESRVVNYGRNGDLPLGLLNRFLGEDVFEGDILVRFTRTGDATLDGKVDNNDVTVLAGFYRPDGPPELHSSHGDHNDDGVVDNRDVTILAGFYAPNEPPVTAAAATVDAVSTAEPFAEADVIVAQSKGRRDEDDSPFFAREENVLV